MRIITRIALVFNTAVTLGTTAWWSFVFYSEAFLGHGVTFIEPNIAIATVEFVVTIIALVTTFALFLERLRA